MMRGAPASASTARLVVRYIRYTGHDPSLETEAS